MAAIDNRSFGRFGNTRFASYHSLTRNFIGRHNIIADSDYRNCNLDCNRCSDNLGTACLTDCHINFDSYNTHNCYFLFASFPNDYLIDTRNF